MKNTVLVFGCKIFRLLFLIAFIGACDGGGGGGSSGNFELISSSSDASEVMDTITSAVDVTVNDLYGDTFTNTVSFGQTSGTATVNGFQTYDQYSCGLDCIRTDNYMEITIVFSNYVILDDIEISKGTVYFIKTNSSIQQGVYYSSSTSISLDSTEPVTVSAVEYWVSGVPTGVKDTVEFSGTSNSSISSLSGVLTTSSGTFSF